MVTTLALVAALATSRMQEEVTLKWDPKVGQEITHRMDLTIGFDMGGQAGSIDISFLTLSKITKVDGDEVTTQGSMREFKMSMNGQEMDMGGMPDDSGMVATVVSKKNGQIVSDSTPEEMGGGERQRRMNAFIFPSKPIKVGDSWTQDFPADKEKNLQSSKAKWTLVGSENKLGYDTWKISNVWSEMDTPNGMNTMGTIWIRKSDGLLVALDQKFANAQFQEGMPPSSGNARLTLVSIKN